MDSIIEKLSDIENTAEAIVEHAEAQKYEIEKKVQAKRDQFDKDLEARTQKRRWIRSWRSSGRRTARQLTI